MSVAKKSTGGMARAGGGLYKRGKHGTYYARIKRGGKDTWKSLKTTNFAVAKAELAKIEYKLTQSPASSTKVGKVPTLAALIEELLDIYRKRRDYKSYQTVEQRLRRIARTRLGPRQVNRITSQDIERCLLNLEKRYAGDEAGDDRYVSNSTRNRYLVELRKVFRRAKRWRVDNPCDGVSRFPERGKERITPTTAEIDAVLAPLRDGRIRSEGRQAADFIEFLSLSGCRVAEASGLTWNRVYLEEDEHPEGQYMLVRGKSDQETEYTERKVPLFAPLLKLLQRMHAEAKDLTGRVFPARGGRAYYPRRPLNSALKISGLAEDRWFQYHGLRHYFATQCVLRSVPVTIIAQWLGHSDGGELVVRRYGNHVRDDQVRHFAARMDFTQPVGSY